MHVLRDRTSSEIKIVKKNFIELVELLKESKVEFMIDAGLLLGIYRDGDLIRWDWDIEFSLLEKEFRSKTGTLLKNLQKSGYNIHKFDKKNHKLEVYKDLPYKIFSYTFKGWSYDSKKKVFKRKNFVIPEKFFLEKTQIGYLGHSFDCPGPIEEYLKFMYGDWSKPKRSDKLEKYLSKDYYKKDNLIFTFLKWVYYKLKN